MKNVTITTTEVTKEAINKMFAFGPKYTTLVYMANQSLEIEFEDSDTELDDTTITTIIAGTTFIDGLNCIVTDDFGIIFSRIDRLIYLAPSLVENIFDEGAAELQPNTVYYDAVNEDIQANCENPKLLVCAVTL